ncbi:Serine protease, subtilisin family [Fontimonas thermophila]|uniref:Serine protease, subtilisin family n=1 Tax=Fontimonas thermophila TaxID=1076937 RepID=A0A1I2K5V6_9GAMM|nr:S8 family peptidase [Fontimonas thermophila]SFF62294.1 Serine protease, subtilisin family [Fontimonas thermophila]
MNTQTLMRHPTDMLLVMAVVALPIGFAEAAQYAPYQGYVPDEVIVQYRDGANMLHAKSARQRLGLRVRRTLAQGQIELLEVPAFTDVPGVIAALRQQAEVAWAEPNYIRKRHAAFPNDPLFTHQWGLHSTGQANFATDDPELASIVGADMNLPQAWDRDGDDVADRTGNGNVIVAIIDDAIDTGHPDLAANIVPGADLAGDDADPNPENPILDHGTLVTGALGAIGDNGIGVAGVAWNVKLMPLKVGRIRDGEVILDSASILAAYDYARTHGARIINASYGGPDFSQAEFDAIRRLEQAGVLLVTSAGNSDSNLDYSVAAYPANYDASNIVTVAATNRQDNIASFSQYGPIATDVAAPGLQIVTTTVGGGWSTPNDCMNGGSCGVSGTSFASPYTAGVAALIAMTHPTATYREIKARLIEGAEDGVNGGDAGLLTAGGRIDADNSLDLTPGPSLVVHAVRLIDDGNHRLDPGESLTLEIDIENLWQPATNIEATLSVSGIPVTITSAPPPLAELGTGGRATLRFPARVGTPTVPHAEGDFALELRANAGGYQTQRHFRLELAKLALGMPRSARLSTGLHDEFHTYHLDLTTVPADNRLVFCTAAPADIDILVKRGTPPQYNIDLGAPPEDDPTYFTDADHIGGAEDGAERVVIDRPVAGTYYVTVLNYALEDQLEYTLETFLAPAGQDVRGATCSVEAQHRGSSSGGGVIGSGALVWAMVLLAARLRMSRRKTRQP